MHLSGIKDTLAHGITLVSHDIFFITWLTFFAAGLISYLMHLTLHNCRLSLLDFINHCLPFTAWKTNSARMDIFLYILSKLSNPLIRATSTAAGVALASCVALLLNNCAPLHSPWKIELSTLIFLSFVFFLVNDLANYLSHYLQHFTPFLWELHKVHHSATFLNPLTTQRMHPLGNLFDGLIEAIFSATPVGVAMYFYHINILDAAFLLATANSIGTALVLDALRHSHFSANFGIFDRILLSPHAHQLHHSCKVEHWDKNFGNKLSIWDWCFGTMVPPKPGEHFPYGLGKAEDQDYHTFYGVYLEPLVKIARLWRGEPSWHDPSKPLPPRTSFAERLLWRKPTHVVYPEYIYDNVAAKRSSHR